MKNISSLFLALVFLVGALGVPAAAAEDADYVAYPVDGGNLYFDPANQSIVKVGREIFGLTLRQKCVSMVQSADVVSASCAVVRLTEAIARNSIM